MKNRSAPNYYSVYSQHKVILRVTAAGMNKAELHISHTAPVLPFGNIYPSADKLASAKAAFSCVTSCRNLYTCTLKSAKQCFITACFDHCFL